MTIDVGHPEGQPLDRQRPANVEAEMGLLGAILIDNRAFERVSEFLSEEHFSEEFHRRIWRACKTPIERGQRADPTTLKHFFDSDGVLGNGN